jgi:hypothetical protein
VALQTRCDVTLVYDSAIRLLGAAKSGLWSLPSPIISLPAGFYSNSMVDPCLAGVLQCATLETLFGRLCCLSILVLAIMIIGAT